MPILAIPKLEDAIHWIDKRRRDYEDDSHEFFDPESRVVAKLLDLAVEELTAVQGAHVILDAMGVPRGEKGLAWRMGWLAERDGHSGR